MKAAVPIQRQAGLATPSPKPTASGDEPKMVVHRSRRHRDPVDDGDRPVPPDSGDNASTPTPDASATPDSNAAIDGAPATPKPADDNSAPPTAPPTAPPAGGKPDGQAPAAGDAGAATATTRALPPAAIAANVSLPPAHLLTRNSRTRAEGMVTVTLCEDTNLLATKWCPTTVVRTMPTGEAPHRHCAKHRAEPGDH